VTCSRSTNFRQLHWRAGQNGKGHILVSARSISDLTWKTCGVICEDVRDAFTPLPPPRALLHLPPPRPPLMPRPLLLQFGPDPAGHLGRFSVHHCQSAPTHQSSPATDKFSAERLQRHRRGVTGGCLVCCGLRAVFSGHQFQHPCADICVVRQRLVSILFRASGSFDRIKITDLRGRNTNPGHKVQAP
jgi:hypothetical protein